MYGEFTYDILCMTIWQFADGYEVLNVPVSLLNLLEAKWHFKVTLISCSAMMYVRGFTCDNLLATIYVRQFMCNDLCTTIYLRRFLIYVPLRTTIYEQKLIYVRRFMRDNLRATINVRRFTWDYIRAIIYRQGTKIYVRRFMNDDWFTCDDLCDNLRATIND